MDNGKQNLWIDYLTLSNINTKKMMFWVEYKPQTVHSVRERTVLGPTGLDHFFLSQNVQFEAYILYIKHRSASFTLVQEDFVYLNYIGWSENNTETEQPFETHRVAKNYIQVEIVPSIVADYRVSTWNIINSQEKWSGSRSYANLWTVTTQ